MSRLLRIALLIFAALLPGLAGAEARPLLIAQPVDLSGPGADFGRDFSLGAKIYFDHINAGGGVNGHRLLYRQADTGGSPARSVAAAQAFARDGALVLFGLVGDGAVAAVARDALVRKADIPLFAAVDAGSAVPAGEIALRTDLRQEMRTLAAHLTALGIRSFGIAAADDYAPGLLPGLEAELAKLSARLVARTNLAAGADGPSRAAQAIARAHPQAVVVLADTLASAQFVKRYRGLDPGAFLAAPSMVNIRTLVAAVGPEAARGLIVSQVVPSPTAMLDIAREHRRLMERYADEPTSQATLEGFIAAKALVEVLRRSRDFSGSALRQAMRDLGRLDLGGFGFDFGSGGRPSNFVELTVVGPDGRLLR